MSGWLVFWIGLGVAGYLICTSDWCVARPTSSYQTWWFGQSAVRRFLPVLSAVAWSISHERTDQRIV